MQDWGRVNWTELFDWRRPIKITCLQQTLARKSKGAAIQAGKIAEHEREAISQTRMLARGLSPVSMEAEVLMSALQQLASSVSKLFKIDCRFECGEPVRMQHNAVATHLFRIAQEAINNALKHGKAKEFKVRLRKVMDNDHGLPRGSIQNGGMGLQIMKYRAKMIDGLLEIQPGADRGTVVTCTLKAHL